MACQRCKSERVGSISAKCNDTFGFAMGDVRAEGYVKSSLGIGSGDYVEFSYCLDCGQLRGQFPLPMTEGEITKQSQTPECQDFARRFLEVFGDPPFDNEQRVRDFLLESGNPALVIAALSALRESGENGEYHVREVLELIDDWEHFNPVVVALYPNEY